jgi:NitT/TauT family transport system ATP-binding protein
MAMIELRHLSFRYENHHQSVQALDDLSLRIADGEFLCILGPSGCGKTTLLRLLAGLQMPTGGTVQINGSTVKGPGTDRAIVFQNYTLFPWMTARKNIQFGIRQAQKGISQAAAGNIASTFLEKVGMSEAGGKYPYQLSGGMRQRVAIARALAMDTDTLLLDEPFGALDAKNRSELQRLLETMWEHPNGKRKTVVFVTHDINEALRLADRIVFMQPGKIAAEFPVPFPRPRNTLDAESAKRLVALRSSLLALFDKERNSEGGEET